MMTIALIGAKPNSNAEQYYTDGFRQLDINVKNFDQYEGVSRKVYTRLILTRSRLLRSYRKFLPVNRKIYNSLKEIGPDVVIIFKGEALSDEIIEKISTEWSTYLFYPDNYKFPVLLRGRIDKFLKIFVAAHDIEFYYKLGARDVRTIPWAFDPKVHRKLDLKKQYDVSFVGAAYINRYRVIKSLGDVDVFGPFWLLHHGKFHKPIYGDEYVEVLNKSRINLDIHHPKNFLSDDLGMRAFEVAGSGNFLISDNIPSLKMYLPRIPIYNTSRELREKVSWYLENDHEREEVELSMAELCLKKHTYLLRCEQMLSVIK